jgi:hypothetical protein
MRQFPRRRSIVLPVGLFLFIAVVLVEPGAARQERDTSRGITADDVKRHVVELAGDAYEGRNAGYAGERRAAEYITAEFKRIGLTPAGDAGGYQQPFSFHAMHPVTPWEVLRSQNVLARIDGVDPSLRKEIVVIGAHYDGQGRTGQADPFRLNAPGANPADEIWNSANDNAASVAALLEIARQMKRAGVAPKRTVLFIAFGAEEPGMNGSIHYVAHPIAPLSDHVAMINIEKIGRVPDKPFNTNGHATSPVWDEVLKTAQVQAGAVIAPGNPFVIPESDHYAFAISRIPAIMLIVSGAPDSHLPSDTADRIDFDRVAQAARLVMQVSIDLASRSARPAFSPSPIPDLGLSAHLATPAEADARGVPDPYSGLKVTGVIAGLPAAAAGLQPGDLIVDIANSQFKRNDSLAAMMTAHREILEGKRGVVLPMKVLRGTTPLDLVMKLR